MSQYLSAANSIDIIAGDFNYDLLKVSGNKLLDIFTDHVQVVNKPTHISGSCLYQEKLIEEFFTNATVENFYFADHHAVRITNEKNAVDFRTIP